MVEGSVRGRHRERGQAAPLMAAVVVLVGVLALGAVNLGTALVDRARAQSAADAAALAGAVDGEAGARSVAAANHARLVSFHDVDGDALVTVQVGAARKSARARPVLRLIDGAVVRGALALPVVPAAVGSAGAWVRPHHDYPAVDLPVALGTPVGALAAGRVRWVTDGRCGTGLSIQVSPGVRYVYCHGSARVVRDGAVVRPGELVMRSGNTGNSTGPHLHVGVFIDGVSVCPQPLLAALVRGVPAPAWRDLPRSGCTS